MGRKHRERFELKRSYSEGLPDDCDEMLDVQGEGLDVFTDYVEDDKVPCLQRNGEGDA